MANVRFLKIKQIFLWKHDFCMRGFVCLVLTIFIGSDPAEVAGYDTMTHKEVTAEAYAQSELNKNAKEFKKQYGISPSQNLLDDAQDLPLGFLIKRELTPGLWLIQGSLEGDGSVLRNIVANAKSLTTGVDDLNIAINHYYNPAWDNRNDFPGRSNDTELGGLYAKTSKNIMPIVDPVTVYGIFPGVVKGVPAITWATDYAKNSPDYGDPQNPIERDRNSWKAAREYFYRGLTQPTKARNSPTDRGRDAYLAMAFYALGNVIHVLQDTASPAHVRNDLLENDYNIDPQDKFPAMTLETWVEENIDSVMPFFVGKVTPFDYAVLVPNGKPTVKDFFDVQRIDPPRVGQDGLPFDPVLSKGLSEFTWRNFYSEGTIAANATINGAPLKGTELPSEKRFSKPAFSRAFRDGPAFAYDKRGFILEDLVDPLPIQMAVQPGTERRVLAKALENEATPRQWGEFTLDDGRFEGNNIIFKQNINILIPKMVAYSAALINYFFRGKLELKIRFQPGATDGGTYFIDVFNINREPLGPGKFEIYSEDANDVRTLRHTEPVQEIPANGTYQITFELPEGINAQKGFMLVYRGKLGSEEDAVIGQKFNLLRINITWKDPFNPPQPEFGSDQDLYLLHPPDRQGRRVISYGSYSDSDFGQLDYDDTWWTGPENITLKDLSVPGDYTFFVNFYSDKWQEREYDYIRQECRRVDGSGSSCPDQEPIPPGNHYGDYGTCYCDTKVHNEVRTYFNSFKPVREQKRDTNDIYLTYPNHNASGNVPSPNLNPNQYTERRIDESWWVIQTFCIDDEEQIFITGINGQREFHYNANTKKCE